MVACKEKNSVIALRKKCFTGKDIAASKIAPKSTFYRIIKESGSIVVKKASGRPRKSSKRPSPTVDSAAGSGHHQYRACSGMAAGRCECICTHSEAKTFGVKKGSKEASSLQEKHQGQTDILQKVQGLDC
jgi:hypothetical protein